VAAWSRSSNRLIKSTASILTSAATAMPTALAAIHTARIFIVATREGPQANAGTFFW
jgi:hypothetical protein